MINAALRLSILSLTFVIGLNVDFMWRAEEYALLSQVSEFHDACVRGDVEYLNATLPNDLSLTHFDGSSGGKAQLISNIEDFPDTTIIEYFYLRGARLRIDGNRASVIGELVDSLRFPNRPRSNRHSFLAVYAYEKRNGRWQLVSIRLRQA